MHTTSVTTLLSAGQTFHFHARVGDTIFLNSGVASICAAPAWLETPYFESEQILREDEPYTIGNNGWTSISAREACEIICIAPAGRLQRWAAMLHADKFLGKFAALLRVKRPVRSI
ncbi:MAG: hypothetical protein V4634_23585 [Pseudomonadota bacterium]